MTFTGYPKKKWGQNFLKDKNIVRKIAAALEWQSGDLIYEIGPGKGILTEILLETGGAYWGIEIDPKLVEYLRQHFQQQENFRLLEMDFLSLNIRDLIPEDPGGSVLVVGNIPYNITSPILFKMFEDAACITRAVFMVQKEVGERLVALPGTKEYGLLAINGQLFAEVEYLFSVPAKLFFPQPKVDSAVLKFDFKKGVREQFSDFQLFRKITRGCFQHRRKMLRKSLSMLFSKRLLLKLDADLTRRPEELSIAEWIALSESIHLLLREEGSK